MGQASCCGQRDRNDRVVDIEFRNDKTFIFNYPQLIKDVDGHIEQWEKREAA
jgi:hypothetical protein